MYDLDVPDLIGALADRFDEYDIGPREALHITLEMLAVAMDATDQETEGRLELACDPAGQLIGTRH